MQVAAIVGLVLDLVVKYLPTALSLVQQIIAAFKTQHSQMKAAVAA